MKRIKKLASLLLAMIMVLSMTMVVFAADNNPHTISINTNEADAGNHTYEAYQIFKGDLATVGGKLVLSNIEWGSGVTNGDEIVKALLENETLKVKFEKEDKHVHTNECSTDDNGEYTCGKKAYTAADVAEVIAEFASSDKDSSLDIDVFATIISDYLSDTHYDNSEKEDEIKVIGSGYYLVKDKNGSVPSVDEEGNPMNPSAYTRFLLQVVGDATVNVKSTIPTGDKQIYIVKADGSYESADANYGTIGSHVSYELTSYVPNYIGYDYYYFIMNDTLSDGLTFDGVTREETDEDGNTTSIELFTVKVGDKTLTRDVDYKVYTEGVGSCTFRLAFIDIMETQLIAAGDIVQEVQKYPIGEKITVTYSATVNNNAIIGTTGNENTWNLQYSNNPNETYRGTNDQSRPGLPANENTTVLGQTPDEKTLTYLTELDITKYANGTDLTETANRLLNGAEFTLTGTSHQVVLANVEYYKKSDNGTYYQLVNGSYTDKAPTQTEYRKVGVGTSTTTKGYLLGEDGYYVPSDVAEYNGKDVYKLVGGNINQYVDMYTKYEKITETQTKVEDVDVSIELMTGVDGKISFKGLGAGTYTLTETVTPAGFNTLDPITITIAFTTPESVVTGNENCSWSVQSDALQFTEDVWINAAGEVVSTGGVFAANVINKSGSLLPSTGGIGTTIFYVVGGILVIGAGILLVAKKRMNANK